MSFQLKIVRCRLKTGGKTIEAIREECKGQGMVYRDFENIKKANEQFDGLVVLLSFWDFVSHRSYHLHNWDPADDERMMMAIYYSEQVNPYLSYHSRYKNNLGAFKADWAARKYEPDCPLCFDPKDVEELEVVYDGAFSTEPPRPTPPPKKKKKRRRK